MKSTYQSITYALRFLVGVLKAEFQLGTAIFGREDLPRAYRRLVQALA